MHIVVKIDKLFSLNKTKISHCSAYIRKTDKLLSNINKKKQNKIFYLISISLFLV